MHHHNIRYYGLIFVISLFLSACTTNNVALGPTNLASEDPASTTITVEAAREGVSIRQNGESQALPVTETLNLSPGQSVTVDETGRAIVRFGNLVTLELLQSGEVIVQQFVIDDNNNTAHISLQHNSGSTVVELIPAPEVMASPLVKVVLTLQTAEATVQATGETRLAVVQETNSPLTWVIGLEAGENNLHVSTNGDNQPLVGGQARWVAQGQDPGPVVPINKNAEAWLNVVRNSTPDTQLGEVLLPLANMFADSSSFTAVPALDETVPFIVDEALGAVNLTLDRQGIFGNPDYTLEDCNSDGIQDIAILNGIVTFDFSTILARVQGLQVTVLNRDKPGQGALQILSADGSEIDRQQVWVDGGANQTLSVRTSQPQHWARLVVSDACFLSLTLTPSAEPVKEQTQPVTNNVTQPQQLTPQSPPGDTVVNVLNTSSKRSPENGDYKAPLATTGDGSSLITIDGNQSDWDFLAEQSGNDWTTFSSITHNSNCAGRYPEAEALLDMEGRMQLAYDEQNLYVAFVVNDDGLVTYSGQDERFFLGDSPQLLLDLNLKADFDDTQLSADDIQIDFHPGLDTPRVALWQLNVLSSQLLSEAQVTTTPTDTGYFIEAALPWQSLNISPQPGDRLGVVGSISDNDTPDTNAQECIISTSAKRDWRNPTTWGTVLLQPAQQ